MTTRIETIKTILAEYLGVAKDRILMDSKLEEDLGADSLDKIELMMAFDEEFDLCIEGDDMSRIDTVLDIDNLIDRLQAAPE